MTKEPAYFGNLDDASERVYQSVRAYTLAFQSAKTSAHFVPSRNQLALIAQRLESAMSLLETLTEKEDAE